MNKIFNKTNDPIKYVSTPGNSAAVTVSGTTDGTGLLVDSAQVQFGRSVQLKKFLNNETAMIVGKGSGGLTMSGLFGSAAQLTDLLGDDWDNPCNIPRTITLSAGILESCADAEYDGKVGTKLILDDCVAQSVTLGTSMTQDGTLMQSVNVSFVINGLSISSV